MNRLKMLLIGTGVAVVNFLASLGMILRPERCAGGCGSCSYACVPAVFALVGAGGLVIGYRKLKAKFLLKRGND